jgi:hypothetical protein
VQPQAPAFQHQQPGEFIRASGIYIASLFRRPKSSAWTYHACCTWRSVGDGMVSDVKSRGDRMLPRDYITFSDQIIKNVIECISAMVCQLELMSHMTYAACGCLCS